MSIVTVCSSSTFETLVSVASLKNILGTTTTDDDDLMESILIRATGAAEAYLGRPLKKQTYLEKVASYGSMNLQVTNTPVQNISRILKDDFLISSTEYELASQEAGLIYRQYGWEWTAGVVTDLVTHVVPGTERLSFAVEYVGGYEQSTSSSTGIALPRSLEQGILEIGKAWYIGRKRDTTVMEKRVGDLWIKYGEGETLPGVPESAKMILDLFQRVV